MGDSSGAGEPFVAETGTGPVLEKEGVKGAREGTKTEGEKQTETGTRASVKIGITKPSINPPGRGKSSAVKPKAGETSDSCVEGSDVDKAAVGNFDVDEVAVGSSHIDGAGVRSSDIDSASVRGSDVDGAGVRIQIQCAH